MTFDNPAFDDGDYNDINTLLDEELTPDIFKDARIEIKTRDDLDSYRTPGIPPETLREIEGLADNLRKTKSNMEEAYVELRREEGDIGVIKDELEIERARDKPDQNKIKHLNEEIKQREEYYFANEREYRDLDVDVKNQVVRIRAILTNEKPLGERLTELFKKEDFTILSITIAIGMIISTIALTISNLVSSAKPVVPTP